jgi:ubiquinone/menaquinone biosynthesis C-methylase UbiE
MPRVEPFDNSTAEYEHWFEVNRAIYMSELKAVRRLLPVHGEGVEIGVGTGRFAVPLGVEFGVEPSVRMGKIAKQRGVLVVQGTGESLPLADAQFDFALMVTTICFLDDVERAFQEVYRVLKNKGAFVIGFIDKESPIGRSYQQNKEESTFYSAANFYSAEEVLRLLTQLGFRDITSVQTIFRSLSETTHVEPVKPGYGEGSFLVIRGFK